MRRMVVAASFCLVSRLFSSFIDRGRCRTFFEVYFEYDMFVLCVCVDLCLLPCWSVVSRGLLDIFLSRPYKRNNESRIKGTLSLAISYFFSSYLYPSLYLSQPIPAHRISSCIAQRGVLSKPWAYVSTPPFPPGTSCVVFLSRTGFGVHSH